VVFNHRLEPNEITRQQRRPEHDSILSEHALARFDEPSRHPGGLGSRHVR
jgi:hypothetical protein